MKFEILGPSSEVIRVVETEASSIRIGKNASCELCLDDPSVSRVHAVLDQTPGGYRLSDRISVGGTYVNKQKIDPNKPVVISSGDVLTFGQVSVRAIFDSVQEEETGGETVAMPMPDPSQLESPSLSSPSIPSMSLSSAKAVAAPVGAAGFGSSGVFGVQSQPQKTIIKKKKRPTSFERRFLSARGTPGAKDGILEVAMVWHDTVMKIDRYEAKQGRCVTVGSFQDCNYIIGSDGYLTSTIAQYTSNGWQLVFNTNNPGFLLVGDEKRPFSGCSSAECGVPVSNRVVEPGALAFPVSGDVRAKFVYGEVSILVHFVDRVPFVLPLLGNFQISNYGSLFASLAIHLALFSVVFFATNRVDALMVDRIMTASRFATVVEQPVEEEKVDEPDEEPPEEEQPEEDAEVVAKDAPDTNFAATAGNDSGSGSSTGMSKGEAMAAAQNQGLLAQANAMNSMLAAGMDMNNLDTLDWSNFDASAQAASSGYGLGTTGTAGGGAGFGSMGGGGFGPGGPGGSGAIRAAARDYNSDLGAKREAKPSVKLKNPDVSGALDKRIIQKVVRQHQGELRACYEREAAKIKGLHGMISMMWVVSPQGTVTKAVVESSTMNNKNVEQCVANSIKFWRFPAPKGGGAVMVKYPFDFTMQ